MCFESRQMQRQLCVARSQRRGGALGIIIICKQECAGAGRHVTGGDWSARQLRRVRCEARASPTPNVAASSRDVTPAINVAN
ncbi:unnamed protein product [Colias eurytheme]|nr:unnamed protein product [Colias eurytheme]